MLSLRSENFVQVPPSELRGREWASLMWGFIWRGLVYMLASGVAGGLVGGLVGALIGGGMIASGVSPDEIERLMRPIGSVLGLVVAVVALRVYLSWLLEARFGDLRLAVLRPSPITHLDDASAA